MNQLPIDFAPPSLQRTVHRTSTRAWLLALLGLILCVAAGVTGARLIARKNTDDALLAAARARANVPVVVAVANTGPRIPEAQAAAVNAAVLQLNLPWRALQDAIGEATPASIAMLALEPDARKRSMKITAEAKSSDAMIAYVEALKQQPLFSDVALSRHEINELDPARPIRFQIEAEWTAP
jgi:Tfp pilus assembly protein PilN